ncbi:ribonuclease P subunit, putative [Theileria annulata]|uniref:Ribonuclease P subunit, putative n=1 Tax=Theileria annulata TaxID=5874 RepID=Q4UJ20_THEAN|nr:ribonuclease P subunit, putative [Theileria annulata]CAI72919.1 ribonuclease P subunit, putative [Theileria annulata]|eukprot:XP_953597.1 ribonuclease P subunit, putative [Theileria annulata]
MAKRKRNLTLESQKSDSRLDNSLYTSIYGNFDQKNELSTKTENKSNKNKTTVGNLKDKDHLSFLAEKSGESLSLWKQRIENKVLHLKKESEKTSLVLGVSAVDHYVRLPFSKFTGISNTKGKKLGLFTIKSVPYKHALEFNSLWQDYAKKLLGSPKTHLNASKLVAMLDLHGSLLEVVKSNCTSYVGVIGIVLKETQNGFSIVDKEDNVRFILKNSSVFKLNYEEWSFFIYGKHIMASASQRTKSKLKDKSTL